MEDECSRLIDMLPGLIWIVGADARIEFLNQRWCEYTGLSVDEMQCWATSDAVQPDDRHLVIEAHTKDLVSELVDLDEATREVLALSRTRDS